MRIFQQLFILILTNTLFTRTFVRGRSSTSGKDICKFEDQKLQTELFLNVIKGNKLDDLKEEYEKYKKQNTLYTGFVIEKQYEYQIVPFHINNFLKVTFCKGGEPIWRDIFPFQKDLNWEEPLCISPQEDNTISQNSSLCFKFARVQKYTQRNITLYFPNKFVGFIFVCNSSNTSFQKDEHFETIPLTPIISDNIRDYKTFWTMKGRVTKVIPYLHTLSIPMSRYEMLVSPDDHKPEEWEQGSLTSEFWKTYKTLGKFKNKGMSWLNKIDPMEKYDNIDNKNSKDFHQKIDKTINKIGQKIERPHLALIKAINARNRNSNSGNANMTRRKSLRRKISKTLKKKIPLKN